MSDITKKAMVVALKQLLTEKPFNKITVLDITNFCEINRMTFYYHFKDIYDLLEYGVMSEFAIVKEANDITWQEQMKSIFNIALNDKSFLINAYHSLGRDKIETYLSDIVFNLTYNVVEKESEGMSVSIEDKKFIAEFYKYALIGIVLDWVKNNMKEDPNLILEKMDNILNGATKTSLNRFRVDK